MKFTAWIRALAGRSRSEAPEDAEGTSSSLMATHPPEEAGQGEIGGLDFAAAIRAHQAWKGRLQAVVNGESQEQLRSADVSPDDRCVLGQWLHGPGCQGFQGESLLDTVRTAHARFHLMAGAVLRAVEEGRPQDARQLLASDYHRASVQVQGKLAELFLHATGSERATP
ncbi:CZB domain-containing protein [Ideonella sp. NS12-5]|uniref:CZB domain-containing protein n=2 Tax=Ideonella oryzae TaxID=2937441 RepID=A0ABT1BL68_9BURK|nr:CZB domain-containing protein [Ideonella oryzae]